MPGLVTARRQLQLKLAKQDVQRVIEGREAWPEVQFRQVA
jgi:hypothetical protein